MNCESKDLPTTLTLETGGDDSDEGSNEVDVRGKRYRLWSYILLAFISIAVGVSLGSLFIVRRSKDKNGQDLVGIEDELQRTRMPMPALTQTPSSSTQGTTEPSVAPSLGTLDEGDTALPSSIPSAMRPTKSPAGPSSSPSTMRPTESPVIQSSSPSSMNPTGSPVVQRSQFPSWHVTEFPTMTPSTAYPSMPPSDVSSSAPSLEVSNEPSDYPTKGPVVVQTPTETTQSPTEGPSALEDTVTTFYAIGDVPYTSQQAAQLERQMRNIPDDAEFVIHLGDMRRADNSNPVCKRQEYEKVADILTRSHVPVFVILGDNDWNDCRNRDVGLQYWREEFEGFEDIYWDHPFKIRRQPGRNENFSFVHKRTLFLGLNLVGGFVHSRREWKTRLTQQADWTMELVREYSQAQDGLEKRIVIFGHADPKQHHFDFFVPLVQFIENELQNEIPILYLNGDKHQWSYDQNFFDQKSLLRIMVSGGTTDPPLKVQSVATGKPESSAEAFPYDRRL